MEDTTNAPTELYSVDEKLIEGGKNALTVYCERCNSVILRPAMSQFDTNEHILPSMSTKAALQNNEISVSKVSSYWKVDNIYTFENIGFSNTVDNVKYLICADCEIGPIGWHNISDKISYVALSRVIHK